MVSKSVSGSLSKTINSILPRGINMKHVLLGLLIGLLLCMVFSNSVEGFNSITTSPSAGYCGYSSAINDGTEQQCQADQTSGALTAPTTASTANIKTWLQDNGDTICSNLGATGVGGACPTQATGDDRNSVSRQLKTQVLNRFTTTPPADTNTFNRAALEAYLGAPTTTFKCAMGSGEAAIVDICRQQPDSGTCKQMEPQGCKYKECKDSVIKLGADGDSLDIDLESLDEAEFDRWRKCLFIGKKIPTTAAPTSATHWATNSDGGRFDIASETDYNTAYTALTSGQVPDYSGDTAFNSTVQTDITAKRNSGTGSDTTNLVGWLQGKTGISRTAQNKTDPIDGPALQAMNAIPMNKDGTVPQALQAYLPNNWIQGFEDMYKYCREDPNNSVAIIGLDAGNRSLKCLNYNENIEQRSITHKKIQVPCRCVTGQSEAPDGMCSITSNSIANIMNSNCDIGKKLTDIAGHITDQPKQGLVITANVGVTALQKLLSAL